jgi:hypothetical protein
MEVAVTSIYPELAALPPLGPPSLQPRDLRFVHGPAELCQLAGTWTGQSLHGNWAIEEKVDGIRMLWIGDKDGGAIVTRKGEPFEAAEHLRPELERLQRRFGEPMVFDGEYFEKGGFLPTLAGFRKGAGTGHFYWFDALPVEEWRAGISLQPLWMRRLTMACAGDDWTPDGIVLASQRDVAANEDLDRLAQWFWDQGKEGMVLKDLGAAYVRARRNHWLKVKRDLELQATLLEVLADGAAAKVSHEARTLRVAVPPALRGRFTAGQPVTVKAMEWTETGRLRQGRIVASEEASNERL